MVVTYVDEWPSKSRKITLLNLNDYINILLCNKEKEYLNQRFEYSFSILGGIYMIEITYLRELE